MTKTVFPVCLLNAGQPDSRVFAMANIDAKTKIGRPTLEEQ
jgi:hypothetical protein